MQMATISYGNYASQLIYSVGGWRGVAVTGGVPDPIGPTYHASSTFNSTLEFVFNGDSLALFGKCLPVCEYSISLDDKISFSSPSPAIQQSFSNLGQGPHKLVLTNLDKTGATLSIDRLETKSIVGAAGSRVTNTTVEDDDSRITYAGKWASNNDTRFSGNTSTYSNIDGASATLVFDGSAVYIYGDTVDDHGLFSVSLDGVSTTFNGFTSDLIINTLKYFQGNLSSDPHTLTVTNHGTTYFDLDRIIYTTPSSYFATNKTLAAPLPIVVLPTSTTTTTASTSSSVVAVRSSGETIRISCFFAVSWSLILLIVNLN